MNAPEILAALMRGERVKGVLPTCRLEGFGTEAYGEEAIVAAFRCQPHSLGHDATVLRAIGHLAMFDGDIAIFADLHGDQIARLWRLGPGTAQPREPEVGVPFDPDLAQVRGDLFFRHEDHPALAKGGQAVVEAIGRTIARDWKPEYGPAAYRTRALLLRAFGDLNGGAALFAVHRFGADPQRTTGFSHVAAAFSGEGKPLIVNDSTGSAAAAAMPWQPMVG